MRPDGAIPRRRFLRALVYLATCSCALGKLGPMPRAVDPLAARLAQSLGNKGSAAVVGLEYLRSAPREADVPMLVDLICSLQPDRRAEFSQADGQTLGNLLLCQQRDDFEHGRTVNVRGWILSATEVRLCALAALV
jgi:hypothetical protein